MSTMNSSYPDTKTRICYRAWSKDEKVLKNSSSGAVFYELAQTVIFEGGIVFGAVFNEDGTVSLSKAQSKEELFQLLGSKYVQARTDGVYEEVKKALEEGRRVLFCGTPCQCNGLLSFLNHKKPDNLFVIDFICHGVPSESIWEEYLSWKSQGKKITQISFRDKRISWGDFGIEIRFDDGTEYFRQHQDDAYMKLFLGNRILRPSCHRCKAKGDNRASDITLGDYWSGGTKEKRVNLGCSVILVHTEFGRKLLQKAANKLDLMEITYDKAVRNNPNYYQSCGIPFNRAAVFAALKTSPKNVFSTPDEYLKTPFLEKVIRRSIRIIRNTVKNEHKEVYLECLNKEKFEKRALCCGCGTCKAVCPVQAISMKKDEEGFLYPIINQEKCIHCKACIKVCRS